MRKPLALLGLLLAALLLIAARIALFPQPLDWPPTDFLLALRIKDALAAAIAGAGFTLAAITAQARAREPSVDATLTGPAWGALPALLIPAPILIKLLAALAGASLVAYLTARGPPGLANVVTRGVAVAGAIVALAALGLFLGPGLTPTTATAFLHASLGGTLLGASRPALLASIVLVLAAGGWAWTHWRSILLARTGVAPSDWRIDAVTVVASAGAVLVAGVVAGVGLLATRLARSVVGEHPRVLVPGGFVLGAGVLAGLDGVSQALAWPGELPVGVVSLLLASGLLAWRVIPRD